MVDRQVIETHLAECRGFVMEWTTKKTRPDDLTVIRQLHRIDMLIRARWWTLLVENEPEGKTFTQCIKETRAYAEQLWAQDFGKILLDWTPRTPSKRVRDRDYDSSPDKGSRRSPKRRRERTRRPRSRSRRGDAAKEKEKEKGRRDSGRDGGREGGLETRISGPKGSRILIAVSNKKGTFCVPYNAHSNCTRTECKFLHRCNVMISETEVCMGEHPAQDHKGKKASKD